MGVTGHIGSSVGWIASTAGGAHVAVGASATDNPLIRKSSRRGDADKGILVTNKSGGG